MSARFAFVTELVNPSSRREFLKALFVTVTAVVAVVIAAHIYSIPTAPTLQIVGGTLLSALFALVVGIAVLYLCRRRSVGSQAGLLFVVAGLGAAVAAWISARRMFLSEHDLGVLIIVLVVSGATASYGAIAFGRRINNSANHLIHAAREVTTSTTLSVAGRNAPNDLARVAHELEAMSRRLNIEQTQNNMAERSRRELVSWIIQEVENRLARLEALTATVEHSDAIALEVEGIRSTVADINELLKDQQSPPSTSAAS